MLQNHHSIDYLHVLDHQIGQLTGMLGQYRACSGKWIAMTDPDVVRTIEELRTWRWRVQGTVGLVPTMGALHEGHLELIRQARTQNDAVGVSIFVNPKQFSEAADFSGYPRTLERDLELLAREDVDLVFLPAPTEMYPREALTSVHVSDLSDRFEGASRPGHFDGVCLVVSKLFNLFQPDRAYFGEKDIQQLIVIQRMVDDLNIPIEIVPVETVRDSDGVALSSRNTLLSMSERTSARAIPEGLFAARDVFHSGEKRASELIGIVRDALDSASELKIDYISVADAVDLQELETVDCPAILLVAAYCGGVRLIDNVRLS
jgi:pantoate--beta-alanine ligase